MRTGLQAAKWFVRKGENSVADPFRGEIWLADLNPTRGHDSRHGGSQRPVLGKVFLRSIAFIRWSFFIRWKNCF